MRVFIGDIIYILQVLWVYFDSVFFFSFNLVMVLNS